MNQVFVVVIVIESETSDRAKARRHARVSHTYLAGAQDVDGLLLGRHEAHLHHVVLLPRRHELDLVLREIRIYIRVRGVRVSPVIRLLWGPSFLERTHVPWAGSRRP